MPPALAARISRVPYTIGRRRLDTILFAQRVFPNRRPDDAAVATALRGVVAYPALMLTLERMGVTDPDMFVLAAQQASTLDDLPSEALERASMLEFQGALGILERIHRAGLLDADSFQALETGLLKVDLSPERGYEGRVARWLRASAAKLVPQVPAGATEPIEESILSAMAGAGASARKVPMVEWEGGQYRVDPPAAELTRLRRVRREQGGVSLDAALAAATAAESDGAPGKAESEANLAAEQSLGETLASILYAAHLGDPAGAGVISGNVALRHDLGLQVTTPGARSGTPWRLPGEDFSGRSGWRVRGSLLGLDVALGRLALRRIDPTSMPEEPKIAAHQRVALAVTAALLNPLAMSDSARDEIAATLGRGRARVAALTGDKADLDRIAREAGLSEWRRIALEWTVEHDREALADSFSLLELFWLGAPRGAARPSLDAWGATMLPLTGCLCLEMPDPRPWEDFAGRRTSGVMAARAADVSLRVADALATLHLPASLAPGVLAFALQDVIEHAQPAYPEDWEEFGRAARDLPLARLTDFVAALTANGPLLPAGGGH